MTEQVPRLSDRLYDDMWLPEETIQVRQRVRRFAMEDIEPISVTLV